MNTSQNITPTLLFLPQKTPSVTTHQIIWKGCGGTTGQAGLPGLSFGRRLWLQLRLGLRLQQTQQHTVPP